MKLSRLHALENPITNLVLRANRPTSSQYRNPAESQMSSENDSITYTDLELSLVHSSSGQEQTGYTLRNKFVNRMVFSDIYKRMVKYVL